MLRAKRRRTKTHDKAGNLIFNTMNTTHTQSTYKNVNNNLKQSICCNKTIACQYIKKSEQYKCCLSSQNRNPIIGYRKQLDCTRSIVSDADVYKKLPTNTVYKDNYAKKCDTKPLCYPQTKPNIQNRNGWINDKYNYNTNQYLERRGRSFEKQAFNFLSKIPDNCGTVTYVPENITISIFGPTTRDPDLIIDGVYVLVPDLNTPPVYYNKDKNLYLGVNKGDISSPHLPHPPGWAPGRYWGIGHNYPSSNTAKWYFMYTNGNLLNEYSTDLYKQGGALLWSMGVATDDMLTDIKPNFAVTINSYESDLHREGSSNHNCKSKEFPIIISTSRSNNLGLDCSLNSLDCTQTSDSCAKKGYTLCEATNNNCKAVYKRNNPKFSSQGAVSGGSRINRLKYQTRLKAQSVQYPSKPFTTALNTNKTYEGTLYEKENTTQGINATNGTYPVSFYRSTYPQYKSNQSGLCLRNMGLTLNNKPQRCKMPPGQPTCRVLQTLPEKCHFKCAPNVHHTCTVGKKR